MAREKKTEFVKKTLREQLADALRSRIMEAEITPGERIVEEDIAKEYGVSRGPIREALRQLEEEGLISYQPHKGCVVKTMSQREMQESSLIRSTLESLAVQIFQAKMSDEGLQRMEEAVNDIQAASQNKELYGMIKADEEFHSVIVEEAHCEKLYKIWKQLQASNISTYYTMKTEDLMPYDFVGSNHQAIFNMFKCGASEELITKEIHDHYMVTPEILRQKEEHEKE